MKARRMIFCAFLVLLVVFAAGCSKLGQSKFFASSPDEVGVSGASTPTQIASTTKATPPTVAKATGKATAQPTTAQKSAGGQYIEANKPATRYTYIVEKVDISDGKIVKAYLKPSPPSGKTVSDQDILWSDRYAIAIFNGGLMKIAVSENPTWREIHNVGIWIARASLWESTRDPEVDIDKYVGHVQLPASTRTVENWLEAVYFVNFVRNSDKLTNTLAQWGMEVADISAPEKRYTKPEDLKDVVPGLYDLAKARGWGG